MRIRRTLGSGVLLAAALLAGLCAQTEAHAQVPIDIGPCDPGRVCGWTRGNTDLQGGDPTQLRDELAGIALKLEALTASGEVEDIVFARIPLTQGAFTYQLEIRNLRNDLRIDVFKGSARQGLQICSSGGSPPLPDCRTSAGQPGGSGIPSFLVGATVGAIYAERADGSTVPFVTTIRITPEE